MPDLHLDTTMVRTHGASPCVVSAGALRATLCLVTGMHEIGACWPTGSSARQTLAALLLAPLMRQVVGPNWLAAESEQRLSGWMADHLRVAVKPYLDRVTLGAMEQAILMQLDSARLGRRAAVVAADDAL